MTLDHETNKEKLYFYASFFKGRKLFMNKICVFKRYRFKKLAVIFSAKYFITFRKMVNILEWVKQKEKKEFVLRFSIKLKI